MHNLKYGYFDQLEFIELFVLQNIVLFGSKNKIKIQFQIHGILIKANDLPRSAIFNNVMVHNNCFIKNETSISPICGHSV